MAELESSVVEGTGGNDNPAAGAVPPAGPVRRSMVYTGQGAFSPFLPARTMKYDEWQALLGSEERAQQVIDGSHIYRWGQPYKDQSAPEGEE